MYLEPSLPRSSSVNFLISQCEVRTDQGSYCVGTRRKSLLDRDQINKCRGVLDSDHATNYESRMVAEVNLYWIIYESCSVTSVDLPKTQTALHTWKEEWKWLFGRNTPTFPNINSHVLQTSLVPSSSRWDFISHSYSSTTGL